MNLRKLSVIHTTPSSMVCVDQRKIPNEDEIYFSNFKRFLLSGGTATITHWISMYIFIQLGANALIATFCGYLIGLLTNYFFQYHFVFKSSAPHYFLFPRYLAGAVLGGVTNYGVFKALLEYCNETLFAQVIATVSVTFVNYLICRRYVFNEKD